jgi:calcium-dependent protein kinase
MKKSIVAERVQSYLDIHGGRGSVIPINNCSIHDYYEFGSVDLSVSSRHKISVCFHRATRNAFCCKSLNKKNAPVDILNEINVMCRVSGHKGIVKLHEVYEDSQDIHLVLELCRGGDLWKTVVQRKSYKNAELEAAMIFRQIMESILYCHAKGVLHRDVKLENIFLTGSCMHPVVKLGDFGLATLFDKGI